MALAKQCERNLVGMPPKPKHARFGEHVPHDDVGVPRARCELSLRRMERERCHGSCTASGIQLYRRIGQGGRKGHYRSDIEPSARAQQERHTSMPVKAERRDRLVVYGGDAYTAIFEAVTPSRRVQWW